MPVLVEKKSLGNEKGNQQDQNLFMCNEVNKKSTEINKMKILTPKYSSTEIKARNFLTNLSYRRLSKNDHMNISFEIITVFHLSRKI